MFIDGARIESLLEEEWAFFQCDVEVLPVTEIQDLRAYFIAWVCTFLPEIVPAEFRENLEGKLAEWRCRADFATSFWFRPLALEAALFSLEGNPVWLNTCREYFAYGGSQLRRFVHQAMALVAPRVHFDGQLLAGLDYGLSVPYFFMDTPLLLYAVSLNPTEEKVETMRRWLTTYRHNSEEEEILNRLTKGEAVRNWLQPHFHWLAKYACSRLACGGPPGYSEQLPLFDHGLPWRTLWERLRAHPLAGATVRIQAQELSSEQ